MQRTLRALILIALGLFLYSRVVGNSIQFYINERFSTLTLVAAVGLVLVAGSFFVLSLRGQGDKVQFAKNDDGAGAWAALLLLTLPFLFGWLVPPAPLGASALSNRQLEISGSSGSVGAVSVGREARMAAPAAGQPGNVLDWVRALQRQQDVTEFSGREATVTGFVYRDERFDTEQFLVARYVLSCCVADAAPIGLVVQWEDGTALATDEWVEVKGQFQVGLFDGEEITLLVAHSVTPIEQPQQPYLYP